MRSPPARRSRRPCYRSAGHRRFNLRMTSPREMGWRSGFGCDASFVRCLILLSWITFCAVGIPRSLWIISLVTYHGVSNTCASLSYPRLPCLLATVWCKYHIFGRRLLLPRLGKTAEIKRSFVSDHVKVLPRSKWSNAYSYSDSAVCWSHFFFLSCPKNLRTVIGDWAVASCDRPPVVTTYF
jgi:hypothetical protein